MADTDMTPAEAEAFLADLHVGVLAIERDGKGPLALPIWYRYEDGDVIISMSSTSTKAALLRRHGRASFTVQQEAPPYKYVMVEGPVTISAHHDDEYGDIAAMATRYLGPELGAWYAEQNPAGDESIIARLHPERWLTCDYAKAM
ncbi:MAG: pyridoxamine 5'-phosphate oxidase family protein [Ilumatobacter sp.]